jgi:hypothetical protein
MESRRLGFYGHGGWGLFFLETARVYNLYARVVIFLLCNAQLEHSQEV